MPQTTTQYIYTWIVFLINGWVHKKNMMTRGITNFLKKLNLYFKISTLLTPTKKLNQELIFPFLEGSS